MTRYARSGSTQKHKKMPGDATPWSQFSNKTQNSLFQYPMNEKGKKNFKNSRIPQDKKEKTQSFKRYFNESNAESVDIEEVKKPSFNQAAPLKRIKHESTFSEQDSIEDVPNISENIEIEQKSSCNETVSNKVNKKNKRNVNKNKVANQVIKSEAEQQPETTESPKKFSQSQVFENKKKYFMDKLIKRRAQNGITLLSSKSERKLYIIRKRLKDKGMPPAVIKEIMRKERRKEELKFRKTFDPSKPCYNCRKLGHFLADCPEKVKSSKQFTGICFKCGSSTHTSFKCPDKVQGFPFAKCFICKEQGHISKDCPSNTHGVYIKGGRCNLCGNVNHLKKDCPSLMKKNKEEESFTVHTINEATSIDEEITERKNLKEMQRIKKNANKPRIVKF